jgi:hypothetical protein
MNVHELFEKIHEHHFRIWKSVLLFPESSSNKESDFLTNFLRLPIEPIVLIFKYLDCDFNTFLRFRFVCKSFPILISKCIPNIYGYSMLNIIKKHLHDDLNEKTTLISKDGSCICNLNLDKSDFTFPLFFPKVLDCFGIKTLNILLDPMEKKRILIKVGDPQGLIIIIDLTPLKFDVSL